MSTQQRLFEWVYRRAGQVEALPWHRDEPPALLVRVVESRRSAGRALDLGCGEGVNAVYLAKKRYSVVGVDFVPAALALARARAQAAGVSLDLHESDILELDSDAGFDLVLDSGCLHHLRSAKLSAYRTCLDRWLSPGGDYVLVHFAKRHPLDWRPLGPRRTSRERITRFLSPLRLVAYEETYYDLAFPVGRSLAGIYWLRR